MHDVRYVIDVLKDNLKKKLPKCNPVRKDAKVQNHQTSTYTISDEKEENNLQNIIHDSSIKMEKLENKNTEKLAIKKIEECRELLIEQIREHCQKVILGITVHVQETELSCNQQIESNKKHTYPLEKGIQDITKLTPSATPMVLIQWNIKNKQNISKYQLEILKCGNDNINYEWEKIKEFEIVPSTSEGSLVLCHEEIAWENTYKLRIHGFCKTKCTVTQYSPEFLLYVSQQLMESRIIKNGEPCFGK
ncbi:hypothetical protein RFI_30438 [Reticulomyxa filosa]|uniref:Uncharacterized protein n=1 Tax=Reticulomyxa filosa TaxID=46433 RepID=X6LZC5_RETFI|nr:hypothetical protein RFI_30438 [Reticulomyxa filosa]|eukprot:ETO06954.1 hypothetical protein RFI_30438 [Reticulomyxa filosa]